MNKDLRKKAVLAMELLASSVNDETVVGWLSCGVPDGEISYGSMDINDVDDYYTDDKVFAELMGCFLRTMNRAKEDGLYIDDIVSKD